VTVQVQFFTAVPGLCLQAAAESEMLTELQWRVAALEALHAFVLGPCTRCAPMQAATLTATCASLLQPTLDAVCAAPALQVIMTNCSICQGSRGMHVAPATCLSCCCTFSVMVKYADTISMAVASGLLVKPGSTAWAAAEAAASLPAAAQGWSLCTRACFPSAPLRLCPQGHLCPIRYSRHTSPHAA